MAYDTTDDETKLKKAEYGYLGDIRKAEASENVAQIGAQATVEAATQANKARQLAANTESAEKARAVSADELGDIRKSYGGGKIDLAAIRKVTPNAGREGGPSISELNPGAQVDQLGDGLETYGGVENSGEVLSTPGGEGFSQPIAVIRGGKAGARGTRVTYAGGAPGEEFNSPLRAAQAINREAGVGEWVPSGTTGEQIKTRLQMDLEGVKGKAAAELYGVGEAKKNSNLQDAFDTLTGKAEFGKPSEDGKGYSWAYPELGQLFNELKPLIKENPQKGVQLFQDRATDIVALKTYDNAGGVANAAKNYGEFHQGTKTLTPDQIQALTKPQKDPKAEAERQRFILYWNRDYQNQGQVPGTQAGTATNTPVTNVAAKVLTPEEQLDNMSPKQLADIRAKRLAAETEASLAGGGYMGPFNDYSTNPGEAQAQAAAAAKAREQAERQKDLAFIRQQRRSTLPSAM